MIEFAIAHHGTVPPAATAVSEEAQAVEHDLAESFESLLRTSTYVEPREQAFRELEAVTEECAVRNWDGYGAQPVSAGAIGCAWRLLDQLVDDFRDSSLERAFREGSFRVSRSVRELAKMPDDSESDHTIRPSRSVCAPSMPSRAAGVFPAFRW